MASSLTIIYVILIATYICHTNSLPHLTKSNGCEFNVRDSSQVPEYEPLLVDELDQWILPSVDSVVKLDEGDVMRLSCPGTFFEHSSLETITFLDARCSSNNEFEVLETKKQLSYSELGCQKYPVETLTEIGRCGPHGESSEIAITFETMPGQFLEVFRSCLNKKTAQSIWSRHIVHSTINQRQYGASMPYFSPDTFYEFDVFRSYTKVSQTEVIGQIVGSPELADEYVEQSGNVYMARGHLAARADFMYINWQRATYHYINAQPQWQCFNANNWFFIEDAIRDFVEAKGLDAVLYTGSHETMHLPDVKGKMVNIHLNIDSSVDRLPVPKYYWKVVTDPERKLGVAFIGVNNPHISEAEIPDYTLCNPIENHPIMADVFYANDIYKGVVYVCSVPDASKVIQEIPQLDIVGVLQ